MHLRTVYTRNILLMIWLVADSKFNSGGCKCKSPTTLPQTDKTFPNRCNAALLGCPTNRQQTTSQMAEINCRPQQFYTLCCWLLASQHAGPSFANINRAPTTKLVYNSSQSCVWKKLPLFVIGVMVAYDFNQEIDIGIIVKDFLGQTQLKSAAHLPYRTKVWNVILPVIVYNWYILQIKVVPTCLLEMLANRQLPIYVQIHEYLLGKEQLLRF